MIIKTFAHVLLALTMTSVGAAVAQQADATAQASPPQPGLVTLPSVFGDDMVLQRDKPIVIWGKAPAGTHVEVTFAQHQRETTADASNDWSVALAAMPAEREGRDLLIAASLAGHTERLVLHDVLCGDVWLCAGQSNMRWRVHQSAEAEEILEDPHVQGLRLLDYEGMLQALPARYPLELLQQLRPDNYYTTAGWQRTSEATVGPFSAVAFAFGRRLARELDVPIGLVHNAIGGVPMEAYLPSSDEHVTPLVREMMQDWWTGAAYATWCQQRARENLAAWLENPKGDRPHHPFEPSFLYDAGIAPLRRFALRGVIWYQGESNATTDASGPARDQIRNHEAFTSLIRSWRAAWNEPRLPFYFVQLPGIERNWPPFRETQLEVARATPDVGMAITIDLGHPTDVHPRRKVAVGERLARLALAGTYEQAIVGSGPLFRDHVVDGASVRVRFDHAAGLRTIDGQPPRGFELAAADRRFFPAVATIDQDDVLVLSADVGQPAAVRYAFENDPDTNLVNGDLLPASPFRSDRWQDPAPDTGDVSGSFEGLPIGELRDASLAIGRLRAAAGHAEITDRFAHSGRQSLHLHGGKDRVVTLVLQQRGAHTLSFQAERWTRRAPFAFRVEARQNGKWSQIFDGDVSLRVGRRFLSHVSIELPERTTAVRFRSTSPEGSGVLLDDLRLTKPAPMRLLGAQHAPWIAPLYRRQHNAVTKLSLPTAGSLAPLVITGCKVTIPDGIDLRDIESVRVHCTVTDEFHVDEPLGRSEAPARSLSFADRRVLQAGSNYLWVSIDLVDGVDIDHRIAAHVSELTFSDGSEVRPTGLGATQRIATTVRAPGQDNCHTYRIPGLATSNQGTLIAVYDCRYRSSGDLPGDIDVGMSRSTDGGRTWQPMRVIMDMGDDPEWRFDGIGDPAVLVDRVTGTIWVAATWSHGDRSWRGSGPGMKPEETGQLMLVSSEDDGKSWSQPINITEQVKNPDWRFVLQGPGAGITMRDGTLVFAAQYRSADASPFTGKPFSTLIWSKDRGRTWQIGAGVKVDTTEAQVVELADGSLMINCRDNRGGSRSVYTTDDLGLTWKVHPTSRNALIEPTCMASLLRIEHDQLGALLLFSNPATSAGRFDMTLKVSRDDGRTWPATMHTLYDQRRGSGYSCLTRIDDEHVGVLYEGQRTLHFLRFAIRDLVDKR